MTSNVLPWRPRAADPSRGEGPLTRAQLAAMWADAFGAPWPELPGGAPYDPGAYERERRRRLAELIARDAEEGRTV